MASVSIYLNFPGTTEQAFNFYRTVFDAEFSHPITRFKDADPSSPEELANQVMHVELPILAGFRLLGTDASYSKGFSVTVGTNFYINLEPDSRAETTRLFNALAENGQIEQELQVMFWGGFFGSLTDQFGIKWMFNCVSPE